MQQIILLQTDGSSYLIATIVVAIISILITRAIFSIPKFLAYQKAQTKLLAEIAAKNGARKTRISSILNEIDRETAEEFDRNNPLTDFSK